MPQKLKRKSGLFVKIKGAIDDENDSENITSYLDNHEERSKSETRQETVEIIQKDDFSLPWISGQIDSKPLFKLLEEAHEIGTLDHFLYAPIEQIYSDTMLNRSKKIDFSKAQ